MNTKITITLLAAASFLFAANVIKAQTCGSSQVTYTTTSSQNFLPKWNATAGCISNSSIFDNGNVGVGNSSPIYPFEISPVVTAGNLSSGGTWDVGLSVGSNGSIGQQSTNKHAVFGTIYANKDILFANYDGTTFNERMRIVSGGNVGIGITVPATLLHTKSAASTDNEIRIDVTSGANKSIVGFANAGTDYGQLYFDNSTNNVALYQKYTSGDLLLGTNSVTNVIVKNGGNVGIGIVSPVCKLHILDVIGNVASNTAVTGTGNVSIQSSYAGRTAGTGAALTFALPANTDGTNIYEQARILGAADNSTNVNASGRMYLQTRYYTGSAWDWKSNLVLVSNGNVGIGTTTPGVLLQVGNSGDGTVAKANAWNTFSDANFKTNVVTVKDALKKVLSLRGVTYNWITSGEPSIGFIAQEVDTVLHCIVLTDTTTGYKSLDYSKIVPVVVEAIKQLDSVNTTLALKDSIKDAKIQALEITDSITKVKLQSQDSVIAALKNQLITNDSLLQNQLNQLMATITNCCNRSQSLMDNGNNSNTKSMSIGSMPQSEATQIDVKLNDVQTVILEQNIPNPFQEETTINYTLPDNTVKAQMLFYNSQGKLIQSVYLVQKGKGQLNVFASDLSNGIYTYTLIVDGKIIDSKKMVRNK